MEQTDRNALDLLIKYAAVFAAIAYLLGFIEESWFIRKMVPGFSDIPIADPRYFLPGTFLLFAALGIATAGFVVVARRGEIHESSWIVRPRIFVAVHAAISFAGLFALAFWEYHCWLREALWVATAGATGTGILAAWMLHAEAYFQANIWQQLLSLHLILLSLITFAAGAGQARWRDSLERPQKHLVRLLVAPEAIAGAVQMGLGFQPRASNELAGLSEPVQIVFEGERTYVVRLANATIIRLSREKVWGFASAP